MKKFALYLLFVALGVAALDGVNRLMVETALAKLPQDSELKRSFRYTSDCDAELLVLGASRGVYDYNTKMMADSLHMTCQSISMEGMSVISQFISVKKAVAQGKTKIIIYDLSAGQLSDDWVENQTSSYYPFYWKNNDVRAFVDQQQGSKMKYLMASSFVQYNSMLYDILYTGYVRKTMDKNGYIALPYSGKPFHYERIDNSEPTLELNPTGERYLQQIVDVCKQNMIRLILCDSPRVQSEKQLFDDYLVDFAKKNQLEFWNYSDYEPIKSDMRYFVDPVHINGPAADLFTKAIIARLKSSLQDSKNDVALNVDRAYEE